MNKATLAQLSYTPETPGSDTVPEAARLDNTTTRLIESTENVLAGIRGIQSTLFGPVVYNNKEKEPSIAGGLLADQTEKVYRACRMLDEAGKIINKMLDGLRISYGSTINA